MHIFFIFLILFQLPLNSLACTHIHKHNEIQRYKHMSMSVHVCVVLSFIECNSQRLELQTSNPLKSITL